MSNCFQRFPAHAPDLRRDQRRVMSRRLNSIVGAELPTQRDFRITIVVLTHNRREEVLRSLERHVRVPEQPAIIVVDNASSDGTGCAVTKQFPQVKVVSASSNLGAAGRTLGVRRAASPYVALCDDDTWWEPDALRRAADLFDVHPRLAVVTGRVLIGPQEREDPVCQELARSPLPCEPDMPGPPLLGFLAGASMVRRSAFLEAGGFEPRLFIGGEEELLAVDLAAGGWWLCYVPELVVYHHPSAHRDSYCRRWHIVRNRLWLAWLRRPLGSALRRTFAVARSEPWDRVALRGFVAAFAELPWLLRERRVVPPHVEYGLRLLERKARSAKRGAPSAWKTTRSALPASRSALAPAGDGKKSHVLS
jgi:GT2 family glycosyltransferase